jgi:A/G-specific adenine glycosylase
METSQVVFYKFPENFDEVLTLPGIGRYTAGAMCSMAFNQPKPILDGNVIRVLTRIFGISKDPREKKTNTQLWEIADKLVCRAKNAKEAKKGNTSRPSRPSRDRNSCSHLNQSLMELGGLICTPRNPQCTICPVKQLCVAFREKRAEKLPNLGQREAAIARRFAAFVVEHNGRFLVRQRPAGVVNAHLWEFPNVEIGSSRGSNGREDAHFSGQNGESRLTSAAAAQKFNPEIAFIAKRLGFEPCEASLLCTVKHSITRYRITLEAFRARFRGPCHATPDSQRANLGTRMIRRVEIGVWKTPAQLHQLAFSSAHKKILEQLPVAPK